LILAEALDIPVRFERLGAADGGIEALLMPDREHRFVITCDPWVPLSNGKRIAFRVAHELAHTLFYDWTLLPPRMVRRAISTPALEAFCDQFAGSFLRRGSRAASPARE
jgi:hypothetical protein